MRSRYTCFIVEAVRGDSQLRHFVCKSFQQCCQHWKALLIDMATRDGFYSHSRKADAIVLPLFSKFCHDSPITYLQTVPMPRFSFRCCSFLWSSTNQPCGMQWCTSIVTEVELFIPAKRWSCVAPAINARVDRHLQTKKEKSLRVWFLRIESYRTLKAQL